MRKLSTNKKKYRNQLSVHSSKITCVSHMTFPSLENTLLVLCSSLNTFIMSQIDKIVLNLCSQILKKKGLKGASENAKKNIAKKQQNMTLSAFFGGFRGLNDSSYQISEATFRQVIFS